MTELDDSEPVDVEPDGAERQRSRASIGKQVVVGGALIVLAIVFWELRDAVPAWMAKSMTATVEFATTTERDDARVSRAFEAVRQSLAADAILEPLPNQTRIRHTRLTLVAPTSIEAVALATRMSDTIEKAFAREGEGTLWVDVVRRTSPVPDSTTSAMSYALRIGAAVVGMLGVLLMVRGGLRLQAGADRMPPQAWLAVPVFFGLPLAVLFLPGAIIMALFFMCIPGSIAGLILWKTIEVRRAATWPSTRARITKSALRASHHRHSGETTEVTNVPDIAYEFTLGDRVIKGARIGIGEVSDNVEATLDHYSVGATVPVYYDPKNPENALLERDPPLPIVWLDAIAVGIVLVGLAVVALFWNLEVVFGRLARYFPENAFLPGMAFFILGGVMVMAMLWASRRQVAEASRWQEIAGCIVSSKVEHYQQRVGGARSGTLITFYEAVVEYSYSVNGREYYSTQLSFGGKAAGSQAAAEAKAARYPAGSQVLVHYDPKNPSNAVLDLKAAYGVPFLVVAVVFFGLAIFFSGTFR